MIAAYLDYSPYAGLWYATACLHAKPLLALYYFRVFRLVVANVLVVVVDVGDCLLCRTLVVEDAYDAEHTMSISKGRAIIRLGVSALE